MLEVRGLDARSVAPAGWQAKDSWSFYAERLSTHALWPEDDAWAQLPGRPSSLEAPELERRAAEAARERLQQRAATWIQRAWRAARGDR